jgi:hypothetical protein
MMPEKSHNAKTSDERSMADDTRKLSEDARGLGPMDAGSIVIGQVDEIVGEGGVEVPGCVVTKYELLKIAEHWAATIVDLDFSAFQGSSGSWEWRTLEYAHRRLNTIAKSIGEEELETVFKQAEREFSNGVEQSDWKTFLEGKGERERLRQEVQEEPTRDAEEDRK